MKDNPIAISDAQKRGRLFLISALGIIAAFIIQGFLRGVSQGETNLPNGIAGNAMLLLILVLAFRGGQISLKLAKGCALLFAAMIGILLLVVTVSIFRGIPLPRTPTLDNTLPFLITAAGAIFATWALFLSRDVKDFLRYQRDLSHQKQLTKIKEGSPRQPS